MCVYMRAGKIYHMKFSPPEDEVVAARLQQRADDTEEKVKVGAKEQPNLMYIL
jgi:hypothetical protein